jgi:hypothetical protein
MAPYNNTEAEHPVSFTAMADMLGITRIRLYQLIKKGIFPEAGKHPRTNRPYYSPQSQKKCIEIRRTGVGLNGEPIIFNTKRKRKADLEPEFYEFCGELVETMKNFRIKVTRDKIEKALQTVRPKGLREFVADNDLIRDLHGYFKNECKKSV